MTEITLTYLYGTRVKKKRQFAFVRQLKKGNGANLKTVADIRSAERHAKRLDKTSKLRQRDGANHEDNYFWSVNGEGLESGGADYFVAFKQHKANHEVKTERKGAALASHALVGVSPEWLAETGSPHDLDNPRVKELISQAQAWVESWMGKDAVWAVRYDVDEVGSGVVDILASPIRTAYHKSGSSKPSISVNKAQKELVDQVNLRRKEEWIQAGNEPAAFKPIQKSFRAMQDSWAWFAQDNLSPALERGDPRELTRREHLFPEEFKEALEAAASFDDFKEQAAEMARDLVLQREQAEAAARAAEDQRRVEEERAELARAEAAQAQTESERLRKQNQLLEHELEDTRAALGSLNEKRDELHKLNAAIAAAHDTLSDLTQRANAIIERARADADTLIHNAKQEAARIVENVTNAWQAFKDVPEPFKQAMNHYTGLAEVVSELFAKFDPRGSKAFEDQIKPDEKTEEGETPPILDLVLGRAKKRITAKNDLIKAPSPKGPQK